MEKHVTIDGSVVGYTDSSDMNFRVAANENLQYLVDKIGYGEEWKVVVKSLSDDVGNTVATATHDFKVTKTPVVPVATPFEIDDVKVKLKEDKDVIKSSSRKVFNIQVCTTQQVLLSIR